MARAKRMINWEGRSYTIKEISEALGLTEAAFRKRLSRRVLPDKLFSPYCEPTNKINEALRMTGKHRGWD